MILFCAVCCAIAFYVSKLLKLESRMHPNEIMKNSAKLSGYLIEISKSYPPWVPFAV